MALLVFGTALGLLDRFLEVAPCVIELGHHILEVAVGVGTRTPAGAMATMRRAVTEIGTALVLVTPERPVRLG